MANFQFGMSIKLDDSTKNAIKNIQKSVESLAKSFETQFWNVNNEVEDLNENLKDTWDELKNLKNIEWIEFLQGSMSWLNSVVWDVLRSVFDLWKQLTVFWIETAWALEQSKVALDNLVWTDVSWTLFKELRTFAEETPFQFQEIISSARKLIGIAGIWADEATSTIKTIWDLAASQSKSLEQVTEAFNDAIVWEFERLKEFWIRASSEWDNVTFTFKNQATTVKKTNEEISEYLLSLWKLDWISWSLEKQSQTLNWRISTLKDTFQWLLLTSLGIWEDWTIASNTFFSELKARVEDAIKYLDNNRQELIKLWEEFFNTVLKIWDTIIEIWKFIEKNKTLIAIIWSLVIWLTALGNLIIFVSSVVTWLNIVAWLLSTTLAWISASVVVLTGWLVLVWAAIWVAIWLIIKYRKEIWDFFKWLIDQVVEFWNYLYNFLVKPLELITWKDYSINLKTNIDNNNLQNQTWTISTGNGWNEIFSNVREEVLVWQSWSNTNSQNFTINVQNPVVREDKDIDEITQRIKESLSNDWVLLANWVF